MKKNKIDFNTWLNDDTTASLFNETHLLSRYLNTGKTGEQEEAYKAMIRSGRAGTETGNGHDLKSALKRYAAAASELGFSKPSVVDNGDGTYHVIFSSPTGSIADEDCPSLVIGDTDEYGITMSNHLPAVNALTWVRHANGQVGLASSAAVGIDAAANKLREMKNSSNFSSLGIKELARSVKSATSSSVRGVTTKNPMATSRNQRKSFEESFSMDAVEEIRPELARLMGGQSITSYYYSSLIADYNQRMRQHNKEMLDESRLYKDLGALEQSAKNFTNVEDLGKYVRQHFPNIYNNLWSGELENLYSNLYAIGISHGPKSEGASGVFSFFNAPVPGISLSAKSSRKPAQNLRILQKGFAKDEFDNNNKLIKRGTAGFAPNMTSLLGQFNDEAFNTPNVLKQARKNLYVTGELTDSNIYEATLDYINELISNASNKSGDQQEDYRRLIAGQLLDAQGKQIDGRFVSDALKGLASDGSVFAHQILRDFKIKYEETKKLLRPEIEEKIKFLAQSKLTDDEYAAFQALGTPEERLKALQEGKIGDLELRGRGKKKVDTSSWARKAAGDVLGLNSDSSVDSVVYDAELEKYVARITNKLRKGNFTVRGGATTDDRSASTVINDEILGRAFEKAGYSPEDIWINPGDHAKGLKMTHARQARGFESKYAMSDFNGIYQYIYGTLYNRGYSPDKISNIFNGTMFDGIITPDNHGGVYWNEELLSSLLKTQGASKLIRQMAEIGADVGVYKRNAKGQLFEDYTEQGEARFKLADGVKLPMAEELGASSVYRYEGIGDQGSARMRFGQYEIDSLEETIGKMRAQKFEQQANALQGQVDDIRKKLSIKQEGFKSYLRNIDFIRGGGGNNFQRFPTEAINTFKANKGLVLSLDRFEGVDDFSDYSPQIPGALLGRPEELYGSIIEIERNKYYEELLRNKIDAIRQNAGGNALSEDELTERAKAQLTREGIASARDVQVGLDFGDSRYYTDKDNFGGFVKFGLGNYTEQLDADGKTVTSLDDIASLNAQMIRAALKLRRDGNNRYSMKRAGDIIADSTAEILNAMSHGGSVWEEYNTVRQNEGGYVLLQSMSTKARDFLSKFGEDFDGTPPTTIMNTDDYVELMTSSLQQTEREAQETGNNDGLQENIEQLHQAYKYLFGSEADSALNNRQIIKHIADALNIDNIGNGFRGKVDSSIGLWRSPTLKFVDDIIQGSMVTSRKLVSRGNLMVDPSLAASIKADFDGDRIAIFKAALSGNYEDVLGLLPQYYEHLRQAQSFKIVGDESKNIEGDEVKAGKQLKNKNGSVAELDSLGDSDIQIIKEAGIQNGKKYAGIYGDLNYGLSRGLKQYGLSYKSILTPRPDSEDLPPELTGQQAEQLYPAIAAEIIQSIPGALYQEGINVKNIDVNKLQEAGGYSTIMEAQEALEKLALRGATWNNPEEFSKFIKLAQNLGILESDEKGIFKSNVLGNIGLSDTTKLPDIYRSYYELMMKNAIQRLQTEGGKQKNIDAVREQLNNLSHTDANGQYDRQFQLTTDILAQIATDKDRGVNGFLERFGISLGDIVDQRYSFMPGRSINPKDIIGITGLLEENKEYDAIISKLRAQLGFVETPAATEDGVAAATLGWGDWRKAKGVTSFGERYKIMSQHGDLVDAQKLNIIMSEDGAIKPLASSTSIIKKLVGDNLSDLQQPIDSIDTLIKNPTVQEELDKWKHIEGSFGDQNIFGALQGIFIGNLAHRAAEITAREFSKKPDITTDTINGILLYDKEYNHDLQRLTTLYNTNSMPEDITKEQLAAAIKRAAAQSQLVLGQLQGSQARVIGTEMGLFNTHGSSTNKSLNVISGIADLMYATGGGDTGTEHTIDIVDYKNYQTDKPSADLALQLIYYADAVKLLQEDLAEMQKDGATLPTAQEYLSTRNNAISQLWVKRINDQFDEHGREQREKEWEREFYEESPQGSGDNRAAYIQHKRNEYITQQSSFFENLYREASDPNAVIKVHGNIASSNGVISSYSMTPGANDGAIINRIIGGQFGDALSEKEKRQLTDRLSRESSIIFDEDKFNKSGVAGAAKTYGGFAKYFKELRDLELRIETATENDDNELVVRLTKESEAQQKKFKSGALRQKFTTQWGKLSDEGRSDFMGLYGLGDYSDTVDVDEIIKRAKGSAKAYYWEKKSNSASTKWLKNQKEIRKYKNMLDEARGARSVLSETEDSEQYQALTSTIEDLTKILVSLDYKAKSLAEAFYQRDQYGEIKTDVNRNPIYNASFEALKAKDEIELKQEQEKRHGELTKEYKQQQLSIAELSTKKQLLTNKLNDDRFHLSDTERAEIELQIQDLDDQINNHVRQRIGAIKAALKNTNGEYRPEDAKFIATWQKIGIEEIAKGARSLPTQTTIQAASQDLTRSNEAYDLYKKLNNAKYNLWENEQKISHTTDSTMREILTLERDNLILLRDIAAASVQEKESEIANDQNPNNKQYNEQIYSKAKQRANLELEAQQENFVNKMPKNKGIVGGLEDKVGGALKYMVSGYGIYRLIGKVTQAISKLVAEAKNLDKTLTNLRVVTGSTKETTRNLVTEYSNLAAQLGSTTQEVSNSAIEWLRQGYSVSESMDLVKSSMYLSTLGMLDSAAATEALTSALKGFKLQAAESMDVVDKLTALDLKAATSAGDIAEGLAQFANLGSLAGVTIDEAASYVATISDVTQMSGSSAGQALKTIISRYGNVKAGAYNKLNVNSETTEDNTAVNDVEKVLKNLGIAIRSTNLQFRDFDVVLSEIAEKWGSLDTVSQKAIATSFAGVRQQEAFVTLMQNWDKYEELLETSQNSEGTAEKKYESYQESLQASINQFTASIEKFVNNAEISELLRKLFDVLTKLADDLPTIIKYLPSLFFSLQTMRAFSGNSILQKAVKSIGESGLFSGYGKAWNDYDVKGLWQSGHKFKAAGKGALGFLKGTYSTINGEGYESAKDYLKNKNKKTYKETDTKRQEEKTKAKEQKEISTEKKREELSKEALKNEQAIEALRKNGKITTEEEQRLRSKEFTTEQTISLLRTKGATTEQIIGVLKEKGVADETIIDGLKKQGLVDEKQIELARKQGMTDEQIVSNLRKTGSNNNGTASGSSASGTASGSKGAAIGSAVLMGVSVAASSVMSAISAYESAGTTHTRIGADGEEETVTSSEAAKKAGKDTVASLGWIPGVGQMIGEKIADGVMQKIDSAKDYAEVTTDKAEKILSVLSSIEDDVSTVVDTMGSLNSEDTKAREDAVNSIIEVLYSTENTASREALEEGVRAFYGDQTKTLYSLLQDILSTNKDTSEKAVRALATAQAQANAKQTTLSKAEENYNQKRTTGDQWIEYNKTREGYNSQTGLTNEAYEDAQNANGSAGWLHGAGTGLAAAATGVGIGVGWSGVGLMISGALYGLSATAMGIGAWMSAEAKKEAALLAQEQEKFAWEDKTALEQLETLKEERDKTVDAITKAGDDTVAALEAHLAATEELITATSEYIAYWQSRINEDNKNLVTVALQSAETQSGDKYLANLNISEAIAEGTSTLYEDLARAVEKQGGLYGIDTYVYRNEQGETITDDARLAELRQKTPTELAELKITRELSSRFKEYATKALKEDEELSAAITGATYTLSGALEALDPNDWADLAILQNFADVLGTTVNGLSNFVSRFGQLTYSELMKSTSELLEEQDNYQSLLEEITDSSGSATKWMNEIITQYPDLIAYMSDTPELIKRIMTKLKDLTEYELKTQWEAIADSTDVFRSQDPTADTLVKNMLKSSRDSAKLELIINESGATTLNKLIKYMYSLDEDSEEYGLLYEAISNAGQEYTLTSDAYKEALEVFIDYNSKLLEDQINNLTEQRDALSNINTQREYELKLIKAKLELEDAMNSKKRIYRSGVGFVYEADQSAIQKAQDNLSQTEVEKDVSAIQKQIDLLQTEKDSWDNIWEKKNFELQEQEAIAFAEEYLGITNLVSTSFNSLTANEMAALNGLSQAQIECLQNLSAEETATLRNLSDDEKKILAGLSADEIRVLSELSVIELQQLGGFSNAEINAVTSLSAEEKEVLRGLSQAERGVLGDLSQAERKVLGDLSTEEITALQKSYNGVRTALVGDSSNTITGAISNTISANEQALTGVSGKIDGFKQAFDQYTPQVLAALGQQKKDSIQNVKDEWSNFKNVAKTNAKGSTAYNEALSKYQTAFNQAYSNGYITSKSDGQSETPSETDWKRNDGEFGSKESWDAAHEEIADDIEGKSKTNPYAGKTVIVYPSNDIPWYYSKEPYGLKIPGSPGLVTDSAMGDIFNDGDVFRFADLSGAGKNLGKITNEAKSWGGSFNNTPDGVYWNSDDNDFFMVYGGQYYLIGKTSDKPKMVQAGGETAKKAKSDSITSQGKWKAYSNYFAKGTIGLANDTLATINEVGTEAIITPNGTITTLPANTGIVPADITKNLWSLGEVAPSILRVIDNISQNDNIKQHNNNQTVDESLNIATLTMTINANENFDADAFVESIRARAALTKNTHR